eukprot:PhF_6_TR22051/c0_g1_i1/m.31297
MKGLLFLVLIAVWYFALTEAKKCSVSSDPRVWAHDKGQFRHVRGTNKWVEMNDKNEVVSTFLEEQRAGSQIVIGSTEREISILLQSDLAGIRNKGQHNFQQLYGGSWLKIADCT